MVGGGRGREGVKGDEKKTMKEGVWALFQKNADL